eukprot:175196_1
MLFIRSDYDMYSDDAKGIERSPESVTKIILSSSKILKERQAPLKELKRGKVLLVSYCASQQMFAILIRRKWTHELRFMRYQRGCIQFTNKTNDLSKTNWWRESLQFDAMLVQEMAEKIVVWLIDQYHTARAYEYDTGTWNAKKEFTLDQEYHSYALTPNGLFLVGFKPQYKEESRLKIDDTRQAIS